MPGDLSLFNSSSFFTTSSNEKSAKLSSSASGQRSAQVGGSPSGSWVKTLWKKLFKTSAVSLSVFVSSSCSLSSCETPDLLVFSYITIEGLRFVLELFHDLPLIISLCSSNCLLGCVVLFLVLNIIMVSLRLPVSLV